MADKTFADDTCRPRDTRIPNFNSAPRPAGETPESSHAWYDPRGWSLRRKLLAGAIVAAVVIIAVVVGAVEGTKKRQYPSYTPLNYKLADAYTPANFLSRFDYFSGEDPTFGFVQYVDRDRASAMNLTYATDSSVVLRVDTSSDDSVYGRHSVRLESKSSYDSGLFVFDIVHTPYGCGTWPALWLTDTYNWPANGEIDVLETTNGGSEGNAVTLHSGGKCKMDVERKQLGTAGYANCDNSTHGNAGCGVEGAPRTYGPAMNEIGGGVYALELRAAGIRAWYFPRGSIPDDLNASNRSAVPDPSTWPTPLADFPGTDCDIAREFRNQSIIANIDLCGELGAQPELYKGLYDCPATCEDFVAHNPGNFSEAYWEFRGFRVYQA